MKKIRQIKRLSLLGVDAAAAGAAVGGTTQGAFGILNAYLSNKWANAREQKAREENYYYGERAAKNADKRARELYKDLQSPKALLEQYKEAGLSPSQMLGGGGVSGQNVPNGAQGTGAAGISPTTYGIPTPDLMSMALQAAQIKKTDAETKNINKETDLKAIEEGISQLKAGKMAAEYNLTMGYLDYGNEQKSLYEVARNLSKFDDFYKEVQDNATGDMRIYCLSDTGRSVLQDIFMATKTVNRDIAVLSNQETDAKFQQSIINFLNKEDFPRLNAKEAVQALNTSIAVNNLDESEKNAWNNLLDKLGEKGSTLRDVAIILGLVVSQFAQRSNIQIGQKTLNFNKGQQ